MPNPSSPIERYILHRSKLMKRCYKKKAVGQALTTSDKIDKHRDQPHSGPADLHRHHVGGLLPSPSAPSVDWVTGFMNDTLLWRNGSSRACDHPAWQAIGCADWLDEPGRQTVSSAASALFWALSRRCWSCSSCWPCWRTAAIWPVSRSSWTGSSASSACPARASSRCWSQRAAASPVLWLPVPSSRTVTGR